MKNGNMQKHYELLQFLSNMPGKIVGLHGLENVTEFVLHDLSGKDCFNFLKVGYFVDNPDFNCFKGVAGYHTEQQFPSHHVIWDDPKLFTSHMKNVDFNQRVRMLEGSSPKKSSICEKSFVDEVAEQLNFNDPSYFCWRMKHDNHGLVIFEHMNGHTYWDEHDLQRGLHLLSFCPIF